MHGVFGSRRVPAAATLILYNGKVIMMLRTCMGIMFTSQMPITLFMTENTYNVASCSRERGRRTDPCINRNATYKAIRNLSPRL